MRPEPDVSLANDFPTLGAPRLPGRVASALAAVLVIALGVGMTATTPPAVAGAEELPEDVAEDPAVQRALEELEANRADADEAAAEAEAAREAAAAARATLDDASAQLDEAAADYEEVYAQYERLRAERDAEETKVTQAEAQTSQARDDFGRQIADLYKSVPVELQLSDLVLQAEEAGTALHRADMLGRVSSAGVARIGAAQRVVERTAERSRQHEVVTVGISGAADELKAVAMTLEEKVAEAEARAAAASDQVTAAEQAAVSADTAVAEAEDAADDEVAAAERRIELAAAEAAAERAAERAAVAAEAAVGRGSPAPPVDGKVCPIGAPNGFSDSWLAPRSGGRRHKGVDIFAVHGMPIYAVTDGSVRVSSNRLGGLTINLYANNGDRYYYAHLSATSVSSGQRVQAGDQIGANGNTGNARTTPPHLHWQYHPGGGDAVNPTPLTTALCR